ncbi:MAG: ATP-binding protein [Capsulimonadaceae bacterium]|nr:ATP-binding protein [Capsulimonadaceae bacterium]
MERKFGIKLLLFLGTTLGAIVAMATWMVFEQRGASWALAFALLGAALLIGPLAAIRRHLWLADTRLMQARTAAERISQGHFDRLPLDGDEELGGLASAFNSMRYVMAAREQALREETLALTVVNHRMEAILDATDDGLALLDAAGYIIVVNRRFCEMLAMRRDDLVLHRVDDIQATVEDRFAQPEKMLRALTPNIDPAAGVSEDTIEVRGGSSFLQLYTAPVRDDNREISGQIIALHDITRERELDKMKNEFISVVSHELRTPLTSIKGYTDILLSGQAGDINEIQKEFLGILQGSATRLGNLINDILDISRIESGRLEVKQDAVDYSRIVGDTLRLMKAAADEKDIMLDASLPEVWPTVRGDADKIGQILTNLLSNAIKYTPSGGFVKLLIEVNGEAGITTCVADSGIGISQEDQKKLFQKFFRADNSLTREAGGTGLGLVIVKTMVELLGGSIWLDSDTGRGSKFYFTLPLYNEAAQAAISSETSQSSQQVVGADRGRGLVLIVDDQTFVRDQLQHTLHRRGYTVVCLAEPAEVLPKARLTRPNVILLDMMLADMGSFKVLRTLHASPLTKSVPVVAFSLEGDPVHGQLALSAFSFMRKPLDAKALANAMRERVSGDECPTALLVSCNTVPGDETLSATSASLNDEGIHPVVALTAAQAITRAVTEKVDVIVIDIDQTDDAALFEMMRALKSEEDVARIPIVIETEEITADEIHFHLGGESIDASVAIEYLVEQVTQVVG